MIHPSLWNQRTTSGYRVIHGELAAVGITIAASAVWELKEHGTPPAPEQHVAWADFLREQADALLACDFFETRTLTGASPVFAVIKPSARRIQILGATVHPTAQRVLQLCRNLVMNLEEASTAPGS